MPRLLVCSLSLVLTLASLGQLVEGSVHGVVMEAARAMHEADTLAVEGRERQAAERYLAVHVRLQQFLYESYLHVLRGTLGAPSSDDDAVIDAAGEAANLRNVNLSKLWIVVDPDDRAFHEGLERERTAVIAQFPRIASHAEAGPLEDLLLRLYPDDRTGERQMEALRQERLPPSKRWERLSLTEHP